MFVTESKWGFLLVHSIVTTVIAAYYTYVQKAQGGVYRFIYASAVSRVFESAIVNTTYFY